MKRGRGWCRRLSAVKRKAECAWGHVVSWPRGTLVSWHGRSVHACLVKCLSCLLLMFLPAWTDHDGHLAAGCSSFCLKQALQSTGYLQPGPFSTLPRMAGAGAARNPIRVFLPVRCFLGAKEMHTHFLMRNLLSPPFAAGRGIEEQVQLQPWGKFPMLSRSNGHSTSDTPKGCCLSLWNALVASPSPGQC